MDLLSVEVAFAESANEHLFHMAEYTNIMAEYANQYLCYKAGAFFVNLGKDRNFLLYISHLPHCTEKARGRSVVLLLYCVIVVLWYCGIVVLQYCRIFLL